MKIYDASYEYNLAESLLERCPPDNYISDSSIQMAGQNAEHFREIEDYRDRLDRIERKIDALKPAR